MNKKYLIWGLMFIISTFVVLGARQAIEGSDDNLWGSINNAYLNVSHDENGSLKKGLNASFYDFNVTQTLIGNNANFTFLNVSQNLIVIGNIYGEIPDSFKVENGTKLSFSRYTTENFTTNYDARTDRFGVNNYSNEYSSSGFKILNYSIEYASTGYKLGNLSSGMSSGVITTILTSTLTSSLIITKNLVIIGNITNMNVSSLNVNGSLIPFLDNIFYIGNGTNRWIGNFSTLQATTLIGELKDGYRKENVTSQFPNIDQDSTDDQLEINAFKLANGSLLPFSNYTASNFTAQYDARTDRYSDANASDLPFSAFTTENGTRLAFSNFQLSNVSNTTSWANIINIPPFSNFLLGNLSRTGSIDINSSGSLNISGNITFTQLKSCDTINTDANGLLTCGTDADTGGSGDTSAADDFNLGNYSIEYSSTGFKIENGTRLSFSNFQLSNVSNVTSWSNIINIPPLSNFQLSNVSNTTSWSNIINIPPLSNFQLSNVSNNTIGRDENVSIALWNISYGNGTYYYLRDVTALVVIGNLNFSLRNVSDTLTIIGSTSIFGSLNATTFNASKILQNGNQVQTINAVFNNVNWSTLYNNEASTRFSIENGTRLTFSNYLLSNFTTQYDVRTDRFGIGNYSTEYASSGYKLVNFTSNYADRLGEQFNFANNLTNLLDNTTIIRTTQLRTALSNNTNVRVNDNLNITSGNGRNATIWLANSTIMSNGTHICIPRC